MVRSLFTIASLAVLLPSAFAYPRSLPELLKRKPGDSWVDENCPDKYVQQCTPETIQTRKSFDSMPNWERKAYTDAVLCLMDQPSQLDPTLYPAAINRFFDYAVIHVNRTSQVHIGQLLKFSISKKMLTRNSRWLLPDLASLLSASI